MNLLRFLLLSGTFFLCLIETTTPIRCTDTKRCKCIPHRKMYEFHCPPTLTDAGGAVVRVHEMESRIQVDCIDYPDFRPSMFAKINAVDMVWVDIRYCLLPRNKSFEQIITKLTPTKPLVLSFEHMESSDESLSKEYFKGFDTLLGLSLRSNKLQELDEDLFANTPDLKMINLQENGVLLKPNTFNFTPELSELDISTNGIESIPEGLFSNLKYLHLLHMWNNRLKYLDETTFKGLKSLVVLELGKNKIETIAVGTFANVPKLTNLTLSENPISFIPANLFAENRQLEEITFEFNPRLTLADYALANLPHLRQVVLSHCNLSSIPANLFSGSTSLRVLRLDQNRLQTIPDGFFDGLEELTTLNLGTNLFKTIPNVQDLDGLQRLFMDHNALTRIDKQLEDCTSLLVLHLDYNAITHIDDSAFPVSLRRLSLTNNRYNFGEENPFARCVNLEVIDLSHNLITNMISDLGLYAVKLKELILNDNLIEEVNFLDFQTVSGAAIFLRNNKITNVDFRSAKRIAPQLDANPTDTTEVHLQDNPFKCDCDIYDLVRYLNLKLHPNLYALITLENKEIICAYPVKLKGKRVGGLSLAVLDCPPDYMEECPVPGEPRPSLTASQENEWRTSCRVVNSTR